MILLLTTCRHRGIADLSAARTHAPRLVPAGETDDGPGQVPDFAGPIGRRSQLRAQRRNFAGFPLNRPRRSEASWAAPWSCRLLVSAMTGCQIAHQAGIIQARMTTNHSRIARDPVRDSRRRRAPAGAASAELHADRRDGAVQRRISRPAGIAFAAPLGALLLSDLVLGFYHGQAIIYFSVALIVMIGMVALEPRLAVPGRRRGDLQLGPVLRRSPTSACGCSAASTRARWQGFEACYVAAIPFFQNTVAGDLFYATAAVRRLRASPSCCYRSLRWQGSRRLPEPLVGCNFLAPPLKAPLNLSLLVGNQRLTQGKIT